MTVYCQQADVYRFAPPAALQLPARLVSAVVTSTDLITLAGHGLADDDPIAFRAEGGGSLPTPLAAGTTYYAKVVSPDTFQVAATAGGAAIDLTTSGSSVVAVLQMPWDRWIAESSALVEQTVTAHKVPLLNSDDSIPEAIRVYTAALLAVRALAFCGAATAAVQGQLEFYAKQADKWARGVPLRGEQRPAAAGGAISRSGALVDPRGWEGGDGRLP